MSEHIKQELRKFLSASYKIENIPDTLDIFESGIVHSLFFIQLLIFIEKKFKIELEPDEFDFKNLRTIESIAKLIESRTMLESAL